MASHRTSPTPYKYACTLCARRKIKCDKKEQCSNCTKSKGQCIYQATSIAQSQRHRKRPADEDLLSRVEKYEELLKQHNIAFTDDDRWIPSSFQEKLQEQAPNKRLDEPVMKSIFDGGIVDETGDTSYSDLKVPPGPWSHWNNLSIEV